jgi:hypothetical protein
MSGASSAFTQGYLTDRQAANIKRRDLDLSELIELCAQPEKFEDRVAAVQRYSAIYPELKYFLIVAYFYRDAFSDILSIGPLDWQPSNVPKGGSVETLKSMWRQVNRMYDTFPTGPRTKRAVAHQLLPSLHKDDAKLLAEIIQGKYYRKELNESVVAAAFPGDVPQDPNA